MAKVSTLKFNLKGVDYSVNVNCASSGFFIAKLPGEVSEALDMDKELSFTTLVALEKEFHASIDRYKKAETSQELFIAIRYLSAGVWSQKENGEALYNGYNNKYNLRLSLSNDNTTAVAFEHEVLIKETIDGVVNWFSTMLGKDHAHWDKEQVANPDKYYKDSKFYHPEKYKIIPFSQTALDSLKIATEKIRKVSEMLFNFIEQDEATLELTLTKQKLLS